MLLRSRERDRRPTSLGYTQVGGALNQETPRGATHVRDPVPQQSGGDGGCSFKSKRSPHAYASPEDASMSEEKLTHHSFTGTLRTRIRNLGYWPFDHKSFVWPFASFFGRAFGVVCQSSFGLRGYLIFLRGAY